MMFTGEIIRLPGTEAGWIENIGAQQLRTCHRHRISMEEDVLSDSSRQGFSYSSLHIFILPTFTRVHVRLLYTR